MVQKTINGKKLLIAYFSNAGENYSPDGLVNLEVGNTEQFARKIQKLVGGDMFKIETTYAYPVHYKECCEVAFQEYKTKARPKVAGKVENMSQYDVLFVGYPIWCHTFPQVVFTFLEQYNLFKKLIIPFCTNEGSEWGESLGDLKNECSQSVILEGLQLRGMKVKDSDAEIEAWLNGFLGK